MLFHPCHQGRVATISIIHPSCDVRVKGLRNLEI
jgi:hypothetical protein